MANLGKLHCDIIKTDEGYYIKSSIAGDEVVFVNRAEGVRTWTMVFEIDGMRVLPRTFKSVSAATLWVKEADTDGSMHDAYESAVAIQKKLLRGKREAEQFDKEKAEPKSKRAAARRAKAEKNATSQPLRRKKPVMCLGHEFMPASERTVMVIGTVCRDMSPTALKKRATSPDDYDTVDVSLIELEELLGDRISKHAFMGLVSTMDRAGFAFLDRRIEEELTITDNETGRTRTNKIGQQAPRDLWLIRVRPRGVAALIHSTQG